MVKTEVFRLAEVAKAFATRSKGRELFHRFCEIREHTQAEVMVVDWSNVNAASPSFIDEFAGRICESGPQGESLNGVMFVGDNPYITNLIDTILRRRGCQVRYALGPDDIQGEQLGVLGDPAKGQLAPV